MCCRVLSHRVSRACPLGPIHSGLVTYIVTVHIANLLLGPAKPGIQTGVNPNKSYQSRLYQTVETPYGVDLKQKGICQDLLPSPHLFLPKFFSSLPFYSSFINASMTLRLKLNLKMKEKQQFCRKYI